MALNPKMSNAAASAAADTVCALANNGYLRVYDGTQPATVDTAISTQTQLAELRFGATAFAAASNGVATANAIASDSAADATGTATWYRVYKSDGTTALFDGSVGTSGANLNFATTSFVANAQIDVDSFSYTQSKG
jgi:hypothetical protein